MAESGHHRQAAIAATLATAAVLAAGLGARAALLFDRSDTRLQSSLRTEIKRGVAAVEDVRFVYQTEAPIAFRYARAAVEAEELAKQAAKQTGAAREETLVEADTQRRLAQSLRSASDIAKSGKYATKIGGFDVGKRLHDVREESPDLVGLEPDRPAEKGERLAWHANLDVAATLAPALAFLLGAVAQAFGRRVRKPAVVLAWALIVAGLSAAIVFEFTLP